MTESKKYEKGTLGWLKEQAKKDGFDNLSEWNKWKNRKNRRTLKYNPMSKEFQCETKRLGLTGNQYIQKLIEEGKLPNPTDIHREIMRKTVKNQGFDNYSDYQKDRKDSWLKEKGYNDWSTYNNFRVQKNGYKDFNEYLDKLSKGKGYKDWNEYQRESLYNRGECLPMSDNKNCTYWLGIYIAERKYARKILPLIFGGIKKEMPPNYPGFDFVCIKDERINIKSARLIHGKFRFNIKHNNEPDYFLLLAFNNTDKEEDLRLLHAWIFKKNDRIRENIQRNYVMKDFYDRYNIKIVNNVEDLLEFQKYELIDILEKIKNKEI